jgi:alkylation response protein AidB-like acyl-CoA dehydrogenase
MSFYISNMRDIKFVLFEQIGMEKILKLEKYQPLNFTQADCEMILDEALKFTMAELSPLNVLLDKEGCSFENGQVTTPKAHREAYQKFIDNRWLGMEFPEELGGQGLPLMVLFAAYEMFAGASNSFIITPGLTRGVAHLIESFGTSKQKKLLGPKLALGEWAGTMCLTEPWAGSAVGDLRSKAVKEGDHYLISGTKNFISGGDHDLTPNIIHAVLARAENAPAGIKGISLFLVPKYRYSEDGTIGEFNDVRCGNIEHKLGLHGSPTCTLNFGDEGKCIGYLLGREGEGINCMFQLMNEARIGAGLQAMAEASSAYMNALKYAKERVQGVDIRNMKNVNAPRVPIAEHPDVKRQLMLMKATCEGLRAMLYSAIFNYDMAESADDEAEAEKNHERLELLTPICKAFSSDQAFKVAERAIQVYGGYGYSSEYPVEGYLRDIKVFSIYEGTNGIQALDLLGRKVAKVMRFWDLMNEWNAWIKKHKEDPIWGTYVSLFEKAKNDLYTVTMEFGKMSMEGDSMYPILHASPYLELFGEVYIGYMLMIQGIIAQPKLDAIFAARNATTPEAQIQLLKEHDDARFYHGKVEVAKFYTTNVLPQVRAKVEAINSQNRSVLNVQL